MPLTDLEQEFLTEARADGTPEHAGLLDIECYLERHHQVPGGIIDVVERSNEAQIPLLEAEQQMRLRPDRRSVIFSCGDCDQVHELFDRHKQYVDLQSHLHMDNGGALLLDPRLRIIPGFRVADYWQQRLGSSVNLKFGSLPVTIDPEIYLYLHLPCGQARALKLMAWDSILAGCKGKQLMKRMAKKRREARVLGDDLGRPFRTGLLLHVDYGDGRKRTYYVQRHKIMPIAVKYQQRHHARLSGITEAIEVNS